MRRGGGGNSRGEDKMAICTIQVTNICPKATVRQMKELFSYLGDIDELRLFPEEWVPKTKLGNSNMK